MIVVFGSVAEGEQIAERKQIVIFAAVQSLFVRLPAWVLLIGIVAAVSGGSVLITFLVRHKFPTIAQGDRNDALNFGYGAVALVYAFFTGFVVSGLFDQNSDKDVAARVESAAGVELARNISAFESADVDRIRQAILNYVYAVEAEWPLADEGNSLPATDDALRALFQTYRDAGSRVARADLIPMNKTFDNLQHLGQARTDRILEGGANTGPSWSLWSVILLTSGLAIGCAVVYGVKSSAMHYIVVGIVGAMVAANLFLIVALTHHCLGDQCHVEVDGLARPPGLDRIVDVATQPVP
jgi:hypothetical protein